MTEKKLTIKQDKFVQEYIKHGNGTKAAVDAGYSAKTAYAIASENLNKPEIKQEVIRYQTAAAAKVNLTQEYVLRKLMQWADEGDKTAALKALELLGKHLRMFGEQVDVNIKTHEQALKELEELMKDV
jgi:phage terminase small subunit